MRRRSFGTRPLALRLAERLLENNLLVLNCGSHVPKVVCPRAVPQPAHRHGSRRGPPLARRRFLAGLADLASPDLAHARRHRLGRCLVLLLLLLLLLLRGSRRRIRLLGLFAPSHSTTAARRTAGRRRRLDKRRHGVGIALAHRMQLLESKSPLVLFNARRIVNHRVHARLRSPLAQGRLGSPHARTRRPPRSRRCRSCLLVARLRMLLASLFAVRLVRRLRTARRARIERRLGAAEGRSRAPCHSRRLRSPQRRLRRRTLAWRLARPERTASSRRLALFLAARVARRDTVAGVHILTRKRVRVDL